MNCREAQEKIYAGEDAVLPGPHRAAFDQHLAECAACRRIREHLTAVLVTWRSDATGGKLPDVEHEWHAVRRRIRGGESGLSKPSRQPRVKRLWFALPLGGLAAAAALAIILTPAAPPAAERDPSEKQAGGLHIARANSVEAPGNSASTTVFVDDKSGWLIVWASDADPKRG